MILNPNKIKIAKPIATKNHSNIICSIHNIKYKPTILTIKLNINNKKKPT
jgi:hypothetical protein